MAILLRSKNLGRFGEEKMSQTTRKETDRRDTERRARSGKISVGIPGNDNRHQERREYLDRRASPEWRQRWLRSRVASALRD